MPTIPVLVVALFFLTGGTAHFIFTDFFVKAIPTYLPYPRELVQISGVFELLGAIGMLIPQTRLLAAYGLIFLCVAVFPANVNMAINSHIFHTIPAWLLYFRLPFQALFIWFIWWSVKEEVVIKEVVIVGNNSEKDIDLENFCKEFSNAFVGLLSWRWDARFDTVLAEFGVDKEEKVHLILERYLTNIWDSTNIGTAPNIARMISDSMGKLKPGQLLFTSDPNKETFIYCVLWPWGNKKTISIRISPSYRKLSDKEKDSQIALLKRWFGIEDSAKSEWVSVIDKSKD